MNLKLKPLVISALIAVIFSSLLFTYIAISRRWVETNWFLPKCESTEVLSLLTNDFLSNFNILEKYINIKYKFINEKIELENANQRECSAEMNYIFTPDAEIEYNKIQQELLSLGKNIENIEIAELASPYPKIEYSIKWDLSSSNWFIEFTKLHYKNNYTLKRVNAIIKDGDSLVEKATADIIERQRRDNESSIRNAEFIERQREATERQRVDSERRREIAEQNERQRVENEKQRQDIIREQNKIKTF